MTAEPTSLEQRRRVHPRQMIRDRLMPLIKGDGAAALVFVALVGRANELEATFVSADTLAEDTGVSNRTVRRALKRLAQAGVIEEAHHAGQSTTRRLSDGWLVAFASSAKNPGQARESCETLVTGDQGRVVTGDQGAPNDQGLPRSLVTRGVVTSDHLRGFQEEGSSRTPSPPAAPAEVEVAASQGDRKPKRLPPPADRPDPSPAAQAPESKPARKASLSPDALALFDYTARISKARVPDLELDWWPTPPKAHVIVAYQLLKQYPLSRLKVALRWAWDSGFWTVTNVLTLKAKIPDLISRSSKTWHALKDNPEVWDDPER